MSPSKSANLPRIACFHGSGSNSSIFEIQCTFLMTLISQKFTLEFFNAPFERPAGPGVLPAFEECGPYFSWFEQDTDKTDGSGYDATGKDGIDRVLGLMEQRGREKGFGSEQWVGVMGFSQGTRVAAGVLLDQQRREKLDGDMAQRDVGKGIKLRFGVMCNGAGRPMESKSGYSDESDAIVRIPTLHVHGLKDEFLHYGREQYEKYFDKETAKLYEINYHHAMPWVKAESEGLAKQITELDDRTQA
ncbi:serine hydrolase FSH [Aspergillus unguis]